MAIFLAKDSLKNKSPMRSLILASVFLAVLVSRACATERSAPFGLSLIYSADSVLVYWYHESANRTIIQYVADEPDAFFTYSSEDADAGIAAAFDLPETPCALEAAEIRLWPSDPFPESPGGLNSQFQLSLYHALPQGDRSSAFWGETVTSTSPGSHQWLSYGVHRIAEQPVAFLEFHWLDGTPMAPLPAVKNSIGFVNTFQGHRQGSAIRWDQIPDMAACMRLVVNTSDIDGGLVRGSAFPDSFTVFILEDPGDEAFGEGDRRTCVDSMHISLPRRIHEGKYVSVAAWYGDTLTAKTPLVPIEVATAIPAVSGPVLPVAQLSQNFPNPFNAETVIYSTSPSTIKIVDILGREIAKIDPTRTGDRRTFSFSWDAKDKSGHRVPSGVYFYFQPGIATPRKLLLLK